MLGETWTLPLGVFATLALALTLHEVAGDTAFWRHAGGFLLLACVLARWRRRWRRRSRRRPRLSGGSSV